MLKNIVIKQTFRLYTHFMATSATITDYKLADNKAEDSYNILSLQEESVEPAPIREATIHYSSQCYFAKRKGDWKLMKISHSGGWSLNHNYPELSINQRRKILL